MAVHTSRGPSTAYVDLVNVLPGLLMIQFLRSSGSAAAFQELFREVLEDPECSKIVTRAEAKPLES